MSSITNAISEAIKKGKWLSISYDNQTENKDTFFWCAIKDINPETKVLSVDIFNSKKNLSALENVHISFEKIKSATTISYSTYDVPTALIDKIQNNPDAFSWLEFTVFENNILSYLAECNLLDSDPYQKDYTMVQGIDLNAFRSTGFVTLTEDQIKAIVQDIYYNDINKIDTKYNEMALAAFSIDDNGKKYVAAYYTVCFNPTMKTLSIVGTIHFNKAFIIDGHPHSLSQYLDIDPDEFKKEYLEDPAIALKEMEENFDRGEILDTRPDLMILERQMPVNLHELFQIIEEKRKNKTLSVPMKAFFGDISLKNNGRKEPAIVVYEKNKVNPDQMRVIYNSLKNPVTYVQGPPGTGKTQTLFNVIVSNYFNGRTMLVCTNNNKPVNGIIEKLVFKYHDLNVPFPYLRLGNRDEVAKATLRIKEISERQFTGHPDIDKISAIRTRESAKNTGLVEKLEVYEKRRYLQDELEEAERVQSHITNGSTELLNQIAAMKAELSTLSEVTSADITRTLTSTGEDSQSQTFLYYSSIDRLNKLKQDRFAELRRIVSTPLEEDRVARFNAWTRNDDNMKLLTEVFPLIFTTNISAFHLGTSHFMFDQVMMDEAGQCDVARSLIPIARGNSLLLVGDQNQLRPVIVMDPKVHQELLVKYKIKDTYNYYENSILSTMEKADNISKRVDLTYHYRCAKKIAQFSNHYFYNNTLKLSPDLKDGNVALFDVSNKDYTGVRNLCPNEAENIFDTIKKLNIHDAVIITPFRAQCQYLNDLLKRNGLTSITACTIHKMQGAETSTVILSAALSKRTSDRVFDWLEKQKEMVNVAVTRAKDNLFVFADKEAIDSRDKDSRSIWKLLVDYAATEGRAFSMPSVSPETIGKSNGSINEDEFYKTMAQLCSMSNQYRIARNVPVAKLFAGDPLLTESKQEFDAVVYKKKTALTEETPAIIFEINGGEHNFDPVKIQNDNRKKELCAEKNITLYFIANSNVKDYEFMREILCKISNEKYDQSVLEFGEHLDALKAFVNGK
jgi:hypothetical protein